MTKGRASKVAFLLIGETILFIILSFNLFSFESIVVTASTIEEDVESCPLWLAPSYTGTAKEPSYGVYAGRSYSANETLSEFAELAVPVVDFNRVESNQNKPLRHRLVEFLEGQFWTDTFVGAQWEGVLSSPVAIPGIGALSRYHTGTSNVDFLQAAVLLRDSQRVPPLSRGAITPYYNVSLKTTKDIPAGMELFADFGDMWDGNSTDDAFQDTIHRHDYDSADKVIGALVDFYDEFPNLSIGLQDEILDFMLFKVLGAAAGKNAKTIRSLIPENTRKLKAVQEAGGSFMYRYMEMVRSPKWLQENGFCMDTLRTAPSTIPDAGRGAFSTKTFRKGDTIAITPMLHIADKSLLNMYPIKSFTNSQDGNVYVDYDRSEGMIGKQLLLNYCFGHPESSMLLFPLGSMVSSINHSRKNSNAYITWSRMADKLPNQHRYHDYTVEQMANTDKIVLTMKIVATKDIAPGEEILLDYGPKWEAAWQDYRATRENESSRSEHPIKAQYLREQFKSKPLEIPTTILENPYPPNVATACFMTIRDRPDGFPMYDKLVGMAISEWESPSRYEDYKGNSLFIVDILDRIEAPGYFYNYTVVAKLSDSRIEKIVNVPHAACTFIDQPYKSDLHIQGAFRHEIGIIDGHFPQRWRDLRDNS